MSRFQAGALVVYGNLGVHEVEGVGLREELAVVFGESPEEAGRQLLSVLN